MSTFYNILFAVIVASHSRLCFELSARVFDKSKFHFFQYVFCVINGFIVVYILEHIPEFSSIHYFLLVVLLLAQIRILFSSTFLAILTITLGLILHLFVFRSLIISIFALANNISIIEIISSTYFFWLTGLLSFIAHNIAIMLFNKFVSPKYLKIIEKNAELLLYVAIICIILVSYMIFNANFYSLTSKTNGIEIQQIILPFMILLLFYIALLMMFNIINLHGYKKKSAELENAISKEKMLKTALFNMTKVFVEFNCTKDIITRLVIHEQDADISKFSSYTDFHTKTSKKHMHKEDIHKGYAILPQNIINLFSEGVCEVSYEYRSPYESKDGTNRREYKWHKLLMQSKREEETNDIIAFFVIYEIHDEKEVHLALKEKSEKDPLTKAFNKEAAQNLIQDHLLQNSQGTFLMIDLDNFKSINDTFGHTYGDMTLCDMHDEIKKHFRSEDIIARIGGDEFIVFTPDNLSQKALKAKAKNLCVSLERIYKNNTGAKVTVSSSIGISQAPINGITYQSLFEAADKAMYRAKNMGKNAYTIYSQET